MTLNPREWRSDLFRIRLRRSGWRRTLPVRWVAVLLTGLGILADLPQARLLSVFPPGAPAGTTREITVSGTDLEDPEGLLFSDPRIHGKPDPSRPATFQVTIPPDVPLGIVDVHWSGRFGVSNPRSFTVGSGPEWILDPTNTTASAALALPLDTVLNGRMPAGQVLWFRVQPPADRRSVVWVQSRGMDSRLEPGLRLFDANGKELDQVRVGVLGITTPTGGACLLQVRDLTFRGGDEHGFRLVVSTGPWLDVAFPNVLRAGTTNRVTLLGRNLGGVKASGWTGLDGQPVEQLTVDIVVPARADLNATTVGWLPRPAAAILAGESLEWRWTGRHGVSNPLLFAVTDLPVAVAGSPVDSPDDALTAVEVPVEYCARFPGRGDVSGVTFKAGKGEVCWIELWSERLGFPSDPMAVVQRERATRGPKGEVLYADVLELGDNDTNLGGQEFNTVTRDPVGRFEAPEDGHYRILVRDLFHPDAGARRLPYRLSIRRESPGFSLVALPMQPIRANDNDRAVHPLAPFLRRGGTELIRVLAFRRDGFNGDIELGVEELGGGLTAAGSRIPAGQATGYLPITAGAGGAGPERLVIVGRAVIGTNTVERRATVAVSGPAADFNEQATPARLVREPLISVSGVEWAPVTLESTSTEVLEVTPDGKVSVPVSVVRREEFNSAFNVRLAGRTELEKSKEASIPEKATNATLELVLGDGKLPEGVHRVWLQGTVAGKYRNNPGALAIAEADLKAADEALASATDSDKPVLEERKKGAEERKKAAEERAKPRDVTVRVYSRPFEVRVVPAAKPEAKP